MALHQYIGARYVPKFYENSLGTAEWMAGVIYEPLTVVTFNGNSYTSKKLVPANIGDPSNNSEYWVATGVFNAQLDGVMDRLDEIEDILDNIGGDLAQKFANRKVYNPLDYGAKGDGATNDTLGVQSAINAAIQDGGLVYIPAGVYIVDGVTVSNFVDIISIGTLRASNICDDVVTIDVPYFFEGGVFDNWDNVSTMILRIDGNGTARNGINGLQMNHICLGYGSLIYGVNDYGVKMNNICPEVLIDGLFIEGAGGSCVGIRVGEDAEVRNVIMKDCHIALETSRACFIHHIHAWVTRAVSGSTFLKHDGGQCIISDFESDTFERTFYKDTTAGVIICSNFRVFCNSAYLDPTEAFLFYDDGAGSCFRYSSFTNIFAERVKFANIDAIHVGFDNYKFNQVTIPDEVNKEASLSFAGGSGDAGGVWFNPLTKKVTVDIHATGTFSGQIASSGAAYYGTEKFYIGNLSVGGLYNATGVCQIYLAANGNVLVKPIGLTDYNGVAAHIEFTGEGT